MNEYPASSQLATIAKIRSIADHSWGAVADWRPIANRARTCVQLKQFKPKPPGPAPKKRATAKTKKRTH
jgi:hypothetical protein